MQNMNATLTRNETLASAILQPLHLGRSIALVLGFSLFTALSAQVAIPLPFTPVPITGQTFAVLLTGALLGSRLGALAMLAYLAEGAAGFPFFTGGHAGISYLLLSPTAGYLLSYPAAAFVTGWLAERGWDKRFVTAALAMLIGSAVILLTGWAWLATALGSAKAAFAAGVAPFILGDIVKIALATAVLPSGWALLKFLGSGRK
jgi:biotin transport system substrate-specific component